MTNTLEQKQLENLLLSEDLEELSLKTKQFNIFNALKLQNAEIRHSNFLGWLMAPYETHELGDYFLKEFLKSAIKDFSCDDRLEMNLSKIALKSFANAEIRREYKNIDILVIDNDSKFICVIENKTWTGEHDNQLLRYAQIVDKDFAEYEKLFIFLTPPKSLEDFGSLIERQDKNCQAQKYYYLPMSYEQVFKAIEKTLKFNEKRLNSDVKTFIEHYKNMIERNIMGKTTKKEIEQCKKIYREHKNAIDLINKVINCKSEINGALRVALLRRGNIDVVDSGNDYILCLPKNTNWGNNDIKVYLHFVGNFRWKDALYVEIVLTCNPESQEQMQIRKKLIEYLQSRLNFKKFNGKIGWEYTLSQKLLTEDDYYKCTDLKEVINILNSRLDEIKATYIDDLRDALNEFSEK